MGNKEGVNDCSFNYCIRYNTTAVEGWSPTATAEDQNTNHAQLLERYGQVYKMREQGT